MLTQLNANFSIDSSFVKMSNVKIQIQTNLDNGIPECVGVLDWLLVLLRVVFHGWAVSHILKGLGRSVDIRHFRSIFFFFFVDRSVLDHVCKKSRKYFFTIIAFNFIKLSNLNCCFFVLKALIKWRCHWLQSKLVKPFFIKFCWQKKSFLIWVWAFFVDTLNRSLSAKVWQVWIFWEAQIFSTQFCKIKTKIANVSIWLLVKSN